MALSTLILVCLVFVLAGFTKGIIGLGLPTIAMGLLVVVLPPAEAAALLILPSLVTNVWQMLDGPHLGPLLRRLWPLNVGVCLGTWLGAILLAGIGGRHGGLALGVALLAYAASGLAALRLVVPRVAEPVLGPITGALTGGITAATGVFVIPAVPYLQAIGLHKDELVQALGTLLHRVNSGAGGCVGRRRRLCARYRHAVAAGRRPFPGRHAAWPIGTCPVAAADLPVVLLPRASGARRLSRTAWSRLSD